MKKSLLAALLTAGMLFTAACSGTPATPGTTSSGSEAAGGKTKIAYVVKAMSDQFWIDMKAGAEKAAATNNVELTFQAPEKETDVDKQIQMVENAIASKVNAIILSAADSKALIPSIVKANQANIPVVLVNDTIDDAALQAAGGKVVTYVGIDQKASAQLAGDYAVKTIKQGNVVLLEGISGVKALQDRLDGFKDPVVAAGTFKIVASQTANNDRAQAFNVMQNILTSNKEVDVVWAINAEMGQGAVQAIQQSNYGRPVAVFDFDASKDDIEAIKAGTLTGSVAQFPELQAEGAIKAALDALAGKTLEAHTQTKAELITKDNVEAFASSRPS
jgi:ABC-type sugar transport system substrate-binding protein